MLDYLPRSIFSYLFQTCNIIVGSIILVIVSNKLLKHRKENTLNHVITIDPDVRKLR